MLFLLNLNTIILLGFVISSVTVLYILDASIEAPWDTDFDDTYNGPRCEHVRPNKFLRERANSMSNLVFCTAGVYMILAGVYDFRQVDRNCVSSGGYYGGLRSRIEWSIVLGLCTFFAGFGSFYYHASHGDKMGGQTDIASIYILLFACICSITFNTVSVIRAAYFPSSSTKRSDQLLSLAFLILWCAGLVRSLTSHTHEYDSIMDVTPTLEYRYWKKTLFWGGWQTMKIVMMIVVFSLLAIAISGSVVANKKLSIKTHEKPFLIVAVIWLLLAFFVWAPYEIFGNCEVFYIDPDSLFQLHALWHGAMSLAVWFMYLYFRTFGMEHPIDTSFLLLSSSSSSSKAAASSFIDSSGLELSQKGVTGVSTREIDLV